MATELPDEVDCRQLADEIGSLSGAIAAARMTRVGGVFRLAGEARVRLDFSRDDDRNVAIDGAIEAPLEAQCQRCLEWMALELCIAVYTLALPSGDDGFACEHNIVAVPEGRLRLAEFVEDEVLLACPMIPVHDEQSCGAPAEPGPAPGEERHKPFAGLADLIKNQG